LYHKNLKFLAKLVSFFDNPQFFYIFVSENNLLNLIKIMKKLKFIGMIFTIFLVISCKKTTNFDPNVPDALATNRDTITDPSEDFFAHANGGWFKRNPIPDDVNSNGIWRIIQDTINNQIKTICERAANADAEIGSNKQKIGDFYTSGMDTISIEKLKLNPLKDEFKKIDAVTDTNTLMNTIGHLQTIGVSAGFGFYVAQDDKISTKYALQFMQGGLGMGNRDYYFNTDSETVTIRNEYVKHLQIMYKFCDFRNADAKSDNARIIMKLETDLAKASRKLEALRDPEKNYNKMSVDQFKTLTPNIDWVKVLPVMGIQKADSVIVGQPEFYKSLNNMVKSYPISDWKKYLKWNLINTYASYLNSDVEKQNFKFFSTIMNGVKVQKPRWKRVVEDTDGYLGELIGQVYVKEYLPEGSKEKLLQIGNNIKDVYGSHIKKLDWMSEETKLKALIKLKKIVMKVGYPDKWKDLSSINIDKNSYCSNVISANVWQYNYNITKFGKQVDRNEWQMQPQTYNAYYNPSNNEIVVPACNIIVPGYEGRMPDDAILYGIIGGSTFGHEITHGFDDQGSQYDENGNLNNWWTAEDKKNFDAKTKQIVAQFNKYQPLAGKFINGEATQGENIADLGGVVMGYEAFRKTQQYRENKKIAGLNSEQRYFLAYGYAWMINMKKEALEQRLMTDVHSPAKYRVIGPLSNMVEFQKTFNIKPGTPMYVAPDKMVKIW
jgi:putative endopeptidase